VNPRLATHLLTNGEEMLRWWLDEQPIRRPESPGGVAYQREFHPPQEWMEEGAHHLFEMEKDYIPGEDDEGYEEDYTSKDIYPIN